MDKAGRGVETCKTKICPVCKKQFVPSRPEYVTCSRKCEANNRRVKRETYACENCGKSFKRLASRVTQGRNAFCTKKCYGEHKRISQLGEKNNNWKGGTSKCERSRRGGNKLYRKGQYYETKTRKELEEVGFYTIRSAASKGIWDIVAVNKYFVILIQVKANNWVGPRERKQMEEFKCPENTIRQIWRYFGMGKKEISTWVNGKWNKEIAK